MKPLDIAAIGMALAGTALLIIIAWAMSAGRACCIAGGSAQLAAGLLFGGVILYMGGNDPS